MRYIAFKWHRILITFDVVNAGKKNPAVEREKNKHYYFYRSHLEV